MSLPYPLTLVLSSLALRSGHLHHSCLYIYPRGYSSKVGNKYNWKEDDIIIVVACPFVLSRARPVILVTSLRSACTEGSRPDADFPTIHETYYVFQNLTVALSFAMLPEYMKHILCVCGAGCSLFGYFYTRR